MALLSWSARTSAFLDGAKTAAFAAASPRATRRRGLGAFITKKLKEHQHRVAKRRQAARRAEAQMLAAEKQRRLELVKSWYDSGRRLTDPWARSSSDI
eukprot:7375851-Prymnesium_polylepis.2